MSLLTSFLNLFKYDPVNDKVKTFNITKALNENWDKIDAKVEEISNTVKNVETSTGAQEKASAALTAANEYTDQVAESKVDKVLGKGLSTNDFDNTEKNNLKTVFDSFVGRYLHSRKVEDANNAQMTGFYYLLSNAINKPPLGIDFALLVMSYSDKWISQTAIDWNTNTIYQRSCKNGVWSSWDTQAKTIDVMNAISSGAINIDPNTTLESYILTNHANAPLGGGTYWHILTLFYNSKGIGSNKCQIAVSYNSGTPKMLYRQLFQGTWTPWMEDFNQSNYGNVIWANLPLTLGLVHGNSVIVAQTSGTITIPTHANVPYPIGTQITILNGTANVTIAPSSGVTLSSKDTKRAIDGTYSSATLIKVSDNWWYLIGALK